MNNLQERLGKQIVEVWNYIQIYIIKIRIISEEEAVNLIL